MLDSVSEQMSAEVQVLAFDMFHVVALSSHTQHRNPKLRAAPPPMLPDDVTFGEMSVWLVKIFDPGILWPQSERISEPFLPPTGGKAIWRNMWKMWRSLLIISWTLRPGLIPVSGSLEPHEGSETWVKMWTLSWRSQFFWLNVDGRVIDDPKVELMEVTSLLLRFFDGATVSQLDRTNNSMRRTSLLGAGSRSSLTGRYFSHLSFWEKSAWFKSCSYDRFDSWTTRFYI